MVYSTSADVHVEHLVPVLFDSCGDACSFAPFVEPQSAIVLSDTHLVENPAQARRRNEVLLQDERQKPC